MDGLGTAAPSSYQQRTSSHSELRAAEPVTQPITGNGTAIKLGKTPEAFEPYPVLGYACPSNNVIAQNVTPETGLPSSENVSKHVHQSLPQRDDINNIDLNAQFISITLLDPFQSDPWLQKGWITETDQGLALNTLSDIANDPNLSEEEKEAKIGKVAFDLCTPIEKGKKVPLDRLRLGMLLYRELLTHHIKRHEGSQEPKRLYLANYFIAVGLHETTTNGDTKALKKAGEHFLVADNVWKTSPLSIHTIMDIRSRPSYQKFHNSHVAEQGPLAKLFSQLPKPIKT
ncbi:hypothetical protein HOH87_05595 [bacterium]|jgi:hypothetical protein|nr:hypothetical protein [bacterium]